MNAMTCHNCGAGLEADRIDSSLGIVTCSHCGSLHDIPSESLTQTPATTGSKSAVKPERLEVALPEKFKVRRGPGSMEIRWPVGGLFHGFVLTIMAGAIGYMALDTGLWPLLGLSVGVLYFAAVRTFNEHRIRIDNARLNVVQGPLPWMGKRKLDTSDIVQLYASEYETRVETGDKEDHRVQVNKLYRLSANTGENRRITILKGLHDPLQVLWLEQEIERLLNIKNKPMAGEHVL